MGAVVDGGYTTFTLDGINVPASMVKDQIFELIYGGIFGFVEEQSKFQVRDYSVRPGDSGHEHFYATEAEARSVAREYSIGTIYRNIVETDGWAITNLLTSFTSSQVYRTIRVDGLKVQTRDYPYQNRLLTSFIGRISNSKCKDALNKVASLLGYGGGLESLLKTLVDSNGLRESVTRFENLFPASSDEYVASAATSVQDKAIVFNRRDYSSQDMNNIEGSDTLDLIHELFHLAGGGATHSKIADAMYKVSKTLGDTPIVFAKQNPSINGGKTMTFDRPATDKSAVGFRRDTVNSTYMNAWINTYCPAGAAK